MAVLEDAARISIEGNWSTKKGRVQSHLQNLQFISKETNGYVGTETHSMSQHSLVMIITNSTLIRHSSSWPYICVHSCAERLEWYHTTSSHTGNRYFASCHCHQLSEAERKSDDQSQPQRCTGEEDSKACNKHLLKHHLRKMVLHVTLLYSDIHAS